MSRDPHDLTGTLPVSEEDIANDVWLYCDITTGDPWFRCAHCNRWVPRTHLEQHTLTNAS